MKHLKSTRKALTAATALLMAAGATMLQSCDKDVLTGQPSWLGNSIYDQLKEEGNSRTRCDSSTTSDRPPCSAKLVVRPCLLPTTMPSTNGSKPTVGE